MGSEDADFYLSAEIITIAMAFASKPWENLSYRTKKKLLKKANTALVNLLNDRYTKDRLRRHLNNLPM